MDIGPNSDPRIQVNDEEPFAISHAVIERDVLCSRLIGVTGESGEPVSLPVDALVTLYTGPAVVFVGRVSDDGSVVDLVSAQGAEPEEYEDI